MKLTRTLKVLRRIASVSDKVHEPDDALLVSDVELVVRVLKMETKSIPDENLEPSLLLALSKFYHSIGDEHRALVMFQRATAFVDQNRGYYSDIGYSSVRLCEESASEEFRLGIKNAIQELLDVCPFEEDLRRALG